MQHCSAPFSGSRGWQVGRRERLASGNRGDGFQARDPEPAAYLTTLLLSLCNGAFEINTFLKKLMEN